MAGVVNTRTKQAHCLKSIRNYTSNVATLKGRRRKALTSRNEGWAKYTRKHGQDFLEDMAVHLEECDSVKREVGFGIRIVNVHVQRVNIGVRFYLKCVNCFVRCPSFSFPFA